MTTRKLALLLAIAIWRGDSRFGRRQHRLELLHESRLLP
jgi:hypothetical protein